MAEKNTIITTNFRFHRDRYNQLRSFLISNNYVADKATYSQEYVYPIFMTAKSQENCYLTANFSFRYHQKWKIDAGDRGRVNIVDCASYNDFFRALLQVI